MTKPTTKTPPAARPAGLEPQTPAGGTGSSAAAGRRRWSAPPLGSISLLVVWASLIILFAILEPDTFLTLDTATSIASAQAITAIIALALVAPIAANVFDLSIAANMGMSVMLVAALQAELGVPAGAAVVLTLLAGLVIGAANAFVVVQLEVNSFIATLGTMSILLALIQAVTGGNPIVEGISPDFISLGTTEVFGILLPFYFMLVVGGVLWYFMDYRQTGRYMYATGSNADAARLAGVRTKRITVIALLISGFVASLAGIIFTMAIGSAAVDAGTPYLLPAFAAAFLGATQFRARRVNVAGTIIAVYVLATGIKGLQLSGTPFWVEQLFNGTALIVAVAFAVRSARRRGIRTS